VSLGATSLSASAQRDAVLSQVSVKCHSAPASQLCLAVATDSVISAGSLAQLFRRSTPQFHSDGQSSQPTGGTDGTGQKPNIVCQTGN